MKRIAFVISLLTMSCTFASAQQDYFIFIWSENAQPFYVRLSEQTYSSSAIGHLVIPRLKDSTYTLQIGFPRKQYPEQTFVVSFNRKDLDYQLKNTEANEWVLINAQTSETLMPRQESKTKSFDLSLGERRTGGFATLMSALVNDSAVLYKSITKAEVPDKPAITAPQADSPVIVEKETPPPTAAVAVATPVPVVETVQPATDTPLVKTDTPLPLSTVIAVQEWGNDKGKGYIFYDSTTTGIDTISLVIEYEQGVPLPVSGEVIAAPAKIDSVKTQAAPDTIAVVAQKQSLPASKDSAELVVANMPPDTAMAKDLALKSVIATIDSVQKEVVVKTPPDTPAITSPDAKADTATAKSSNAIAPADSAAASAASKKQLLLMNSDCINFATEYDVDKLRVKMLNAASVDDKVAAAKKVFKTKCFVTRYIRGLSELFPNDEDRFKFFDAAYPFVSDTGNFRSLLDLFTNELYIARFKALVRMQ